MLDLGRPEDDRNRKREAQPKLVTKHGCGVASVTVVASMAVLHAVAGMCFWRILMMPLSCVMHWHAVNTIEPPFIEVRASLKQILVLQTEVV